MNENGSPEQGSPRSSVPGVIVFERMAALLERSARGRRLAAVLLAIGGAGLVLLGLGLDHLAPLAAGALAVALAVLPWLAAVEFDERAEGLRVLGEDWADPGPPELAARRRAGLIDLVERLYAPERSG
jgi:hypothetical protein